MRVRKIWAIGLLVGLIALTSIPLTGSVGGAPNRIEPDLQARANANPSATFDVLIEAAVPAAQQADRDTNGRRAKLAKDAIVAKGGRVRGELPLVGASAGQLSGAALTALAQDSNVGFISTDTLLTVQSVPVASAYLTATGALAAWDLGYTGRGVTVAVLDSGIARSDDFGPGGARIVASVDLVDGPAGPLDPSGHGTHVAGIVAGDGYLSATSPNGRYSGVAPDANLVSVRVVETTGVARKSTVIRGIQWTVQNRNLHNIRIMNLSLGGPATSYRQDPLNAAVEIAWRSGILVVASAGNGGPTTGTIGVPGNDPYIVTVGAIDDRGTGSTADDTIADFSSRGPTQDGVAKPDLVAPGRRIVAPRVAGSFLDQLLPERRTGDNYFRLSGTSMSAPVVAGVAALLLEKEPRLTPDQVKAHLMNNARPVAGTDARAAGAGAVDAPAVLTAKVRPQNRANRDLRPSDGFARSVMPLLKGRPLAWRNPTHAGVNWNNISWDNISWDNISWDNISWDNISWDNISWDNISWDNISWDNISWDNISWDNISWDNISWDTTAGGLQHTAQID